MLIWTCVLFYSEIHTQDKLTADQNKCVDLSHIYIGYYIIYTMKTQELVITLYIMKFRNYSLSSVNYCIWHDMSLYQKGFIPLIIILIKLDDNISKITLNDVSK